MRLSSSLMALMLGLGMYFVGPVVTKFEPFKATLAHAEEGGGGEGGGDGGGDGGDSGGGDGGEGGGDGGDGGGDGEGGGDDDHGGDEGGDDGGGDDADEGDQDEHTGSDEVGVTANVATNDTCNVKCMTEKGGDH